MLLQFYGEGCPHCERMKPLVQKLESDGQVMVEKYEVWHNEENKKKILEFDKGLCGGVPFFYNTVSGEFICGEANLEELKKWAG